MKLTLKVGLIVFALTGISQCKPEKAVLEKNGSFGIEGQRVPDLGNGSYMNPIIGGDYPDPSVLRVGDDYYMTHSSFEYVPGLLIWHSRDLVNWTPLCNALNTYVGSVFAPDLIWHDSLYYIYFPLVKYDGDKMAGITNAVITAPTPEGPWSDPVDLKTGLIDPGHVVDEDGKRYLHLSDGHVVPLSDDGLSVTGEIKKVYEGWTYPDDYNVECYCLESPKLTKRKGYYYITSAEGGTAGPATSHMVVSSRSKGVSGPWEHSPYNPIIHTGSEAETWWSRGHGTLVSTPDDQWYIMYHGYEKGYHTLGRQTLMEPVEWTGDEWFHVAEGSAADRPIPYIKGDVPEKTEAGMALSDEFSKNTLGLQWRFYREFDKSRFELTGENFLLKGKGTSPADSGPLLTIPTNHSYEITTQLEISGEAMGGLLLFYDPSVYAGLGFSKEGLVKYERGLVHSTVDPGTGSQIHLKIVNKKHQVSFCYSMDGSEWTRFHSGAEVSAYHHNAFGHFLSLRVGIFAAGDGEVSFKNFNYKGLDENE